MDLVDSNLRLRAAAAPACMGMRDMVHSNPWVVRPGETFLGASVPSFYYRSELGGEMREDK